MIKDDAVGTIYKDWMHGNLRCMIKRGPFCLCTYIGTKSYILSNINYDNLPVNVHGGFTFGGKGIDPLSKYYWYGWDYGHYGDHLYFKEDEMTKDINHSSLEHSVEEIRNETNDAALELINVFRRVTINYWTISLFLILISFLAIFGMLIPVLEFIK